MTAKDALDAALMAEAISVEQREYVACKWREFGAAVRAARRKQGITRDEFARAMKFTPAMLSMLECGDRRWKPDMARKAVECLSM